MPTAKELDTDTELHITADWGKWPDVEGRDRVQLTEDARRRLDYVMNNMDLECMASVELELLLPIFHRRPLFQRMLLAFGWNCVLIATFDNLELDVEYVESQGYFRILNVWATKPKSRSTCRVPAVPIPWQMIPLYKPHIV